MDKFVGLAKKYTRITELTPEILHTFVSKIVIHERRDLRPCFRHRNVPCYGADRQRNSGFSCPWYYFIGVLGMAGMGVNYPIYKRILENGKKKYAFEIMELAKEISEK